MRSITFVLTSAMAVYAASPLAAQERNNQRRRPGKNFARGPAVGKPLPDVSAFDAEGKPFRLTSLKGSHTVIVFGCLT